MSDIFISYKREEQPIARKLADALEREGWTVWWDPKLRAGEHFDDVIEKALNEAKCVIVMWSKLSVNSEYIKAEATEALEQHKLVPVKIENVNLPFRFKRVHTPSLLDWDGSRASPEFRKFVGDISEVLSDSSNTTKQAEAYDADQRRIRQEVPKRWRIYAPVVSAVAIVLIFFSFVFWWPKRQETERVEKQPLKEAAATPEPEANEPKEIAKQPPVVKRQPEEQIAEPRREKVEAATGLPSQAPSEHKQEKPIATQPVLSAGKVFRERLKNGQEGPEMVVIPVGSFRMGDVQGGGEQNELPVRTVRMQKPFAIGRYEVTFDEYDQFATVSKRKLPDDKGWGRGRRPVINVSWQDAVEYTKWLSEQTSKRYRLPTEAEWEYAARGGKETAYWWGKKLVKGMANCDGCGSQWDSKQTGPAGSFKPNPFGLYDTAGNVWEWVEDCYHGNYNGAPEDGSAWGEIGGGECGRRVTRGGSWGNIPEGLLTSNRNLRDLVNRDSATGFRLAQDLD